MADLVVASFNLRNGRAFDGFNSWPFRRAATAEVVRRLDADVIGLQEAYRFQLRSLLRQAPRYVAVGEPRSRWGERTPVLVRGEVLSHATLRFAVPGAQFRRIATTARVRVGDTAFTFTSTHLDERSNARRHIAARQLIEWLDKTPGPHVVVGDFNATLNADLFRDFEAFGLRSALPGNEPGTTHHFSGRTDGRRIDHILVPNDAEVFDAHVETTRPGGRMASDHWPVVAHLRIP